MGNTKQRYIACYDIGLAVATALLTPERFRGQVKTIAGQIADVNELQAALDRGSVTTTWARIWIPRWAAIRVTPYHYRQMFDVSYVAN